MEVALWQDSRGKRAQGKERTAIAGAERDASTGAIKRHT